MFEPTREAGLQRLLAFSQDASARYRERRNFAVEPPAVSQLSPWLRHRLVSEEHVLRHILTEHALSAALPYVQEIFWRGYFKGWLEQHPTVWCSYRSALQATPLTANYQAAIAGRTGIECFDNWSKSLRTTGYLHNHARMWFASIWIFTLRLPWELGAAFFLDHLVDGDPASNTLSWRWVAGLHTKGKNYPATADNIARFTKGRFNPVGQLNETAEPLTETKDHPLVPIVSSPRPALGPHLFVVTEEDCGGELDHTPQPRAVLGLVSPQSSSFAQQAVQNTVAARGGETHRSDCWSGAILAAAKQAGVAEVAMDYMPVGPAAEGMKAAQRVLVAQGLRVHTLQRRYDRLVWPHATKGFFKLKKQIPNLLRALEIDYA